MKIIFQPNQLNRSVHIRRDDVKRNPAKTMIPMAMMYVIWMSVVSKKLRVPFDKNWECHSIREYWKVVAHHLGHYNNSSSPISQNRKNFCKKIYQESEAIKLQSRLKWILLNFAGIFVVKQSHSVICKNV